MKGGTMHKTNFKDPAVWKSLERQAYEGIVDYEQFPAAEYKYFSELQRLYEKFRFGGLDRSLAQQQKAKLLSEYKNYSAEHQRYLDVYRFYQDNIRTVNVRLSQINKAQSSEEKALIACECIGLLTGDATFLKLQKEAINFDCKGK